MTSMRNARAVCATDIVELNPVVQKFLNARSSTKFCALDVRADGNCGAYCLAVLRLCVSKKFRTNMQIRKFLAKATLVLPVTSSARRSYTKSLRTRFLESFDISLYCHLLRTNVALLVSNQDGVCRWQVIGFSVNFKKWVFLTLDDAPHYRLLVRSTDGRRINPFFQNRLARKILQGEYPTASFDPLFAINNAAAFEADYEMT